MNKNQIVGSIKEAAGKVQQDVGELTGTTDQQVKGVAKRIEGTVQEGIGDVQQAVEDAARANAKFKVPGSKALTRNGI